MNKPKMKYGLLLYLAVFFLFGYVVVVVVDVVGFIPRLDHR